jgi:hypothetical protein
MAARSVERRLETKLLAGRKGLRVFVTKRDIGRIRKPLIFCVCGTRTIYGCTLRRVETVNILGLPVPGSNARKVARPIKFQHRSVRCVAYLVLSPPLIEADRALHHQDTNSLS